jgi:dTDP-4-dehydrorhamnose reductase
MNKVAVIGANGQVGAELCLMLVTRKDLELVPICRNRSGSAFLRWHGIACRHGRVADPEDASRLLGDCDIVINSSLATGAPAQIRRTEAKIIEGIFRHSKDSATIIHFSTQSVYGDPRPNRWMRWRNPYGRAKLATERQVRMQSRASKKAAFILRLGHVCGTLQEISNTIRADIRTRLVYLPAKDSTSNTVYTAAIIGAVDQIVAHRVRPDTYDLMNTPRWTWREVYEYEAAGCAVQLMPHVIESNSESLISAIKAPARRIAGHLAAAQPIRELFAKLFAYAPESANARAMAWWYAKRARTEVAALNPPKRVPDHLSWVENGTNFFPAENTTIELLRSTPKPPVGPGGTGVWPADLPDARCAPAESAAATAAR